MICFNMFLPLFLYFSWQKAPLLDVLLVNVGIGVVLHVFTMVSDIFWMMWSNCEHANCHWLSFSWSNERRLVILFNWTAFSSKNTVLNFSRCS